MATDRIDLLRLTSMLVGGRMEMERTLDSILVSDTIVRVQLLPNIITALHINLLSLQHTKEHWPLQTHKTSSALSARKNRIVSGPSYGVL